MEIAIEKTPQMGLALALVCFAALLVLLPDEKAMKISEITSKSIGQTGKVYGTIRGLEFRNDNAFFTLENGGAIRAVFFSPSAEQAAQLRENANAEVLAQVTNYKGGLELIVERVREID
ncbi:MAG TPA: hypothetical protein VJH23_00700 [archaeon]|nr:hypothetical protein [archaeon]